MSTSSSSPASASARLVGPPSTRAGIIAAAVSLAMMLIGTILLPTLFAAPADTSGVAEADVAARDRALLLGNALAFFGLLPLLTAVHAFFRERARPLWALVTAYAILLILPLAITLEAITYPSSLLNPVGPLLPLVLLSTTGVAAGFAAGAIVPLALDAATAGRRLAVAALIGIIAILAMFLLQPYIAPLSSLGIGAALLARTGRFDRKNGPTGQG
ncbi:hypothetical protein [Microcella sp.]|uniref:hypothetical protein n=1 Tax=Microcella sp. TaxID=1913979 RepID=UPI00299F628A|nr:hypothetical protein [Microcella sp.]MDX2025104.1 hypothetical protein [Microcella sp.]